MKKSWIYLNLFIDNEWDERKILDQIYSLKLDASEEILKSYTHWGLFFSAPHDEVILDTPIDAGLVKYLEQFFGPLSSSYIFDYKKVEPAQDDRIFVVGVSRREDEIFGEEALLLRGYLSSHEYKIINRKDFLLHLCENKKIKFPSGQIVKISDLKLKENQKCCLKFLSSAGGRGVFILDSSLEKFEILLRFIDEEDLIGLEVLMQELLDIKEHFYIVAGTERAFSIREFKVFYDEKGNSKRHVLTKGPSLELQEVATKMALSLKESGYSGSFGFDGCVTQDGVIFPAIDLNVRIDKSRIFSQVLERFNQKDMWKHYEFRRERFLTQGYENFDSFYNEKIKFLEHGDCRIIVLLCSNMFGKNNGQRVGEITFMIASNLSFESEPYQSWINDCYHALGIKR